MVLPLEGRVIALAETRQLEELAAMLEKEGATILRVPMVAILDVPDATPVLDWARNLIAGQFSHIVFMTGEGIRRLLSIVERVGLREDAIAALGKTTTVIRGPKPAAALKEIGLKAGLLAAAPTTDGLIATLSTLSVAGQSVGVVLHGAENPPLVDHIRSLGARAATVQPYVYAPAADSEKVADLIHKMAEGTVASLVITSSPQVDRLLQVAKEKGMEAALADGFKKTRIAAVGPIAAHTLEQHGVHVDICPDQGFVMKKLVQLIAREFDH